MTKQEAFEEINNTQDYYVNELLNKINSTAEEYMKVINFQSPTGTGKTKMMAKLMNLMPDVFFIVTTLSKGQLDRQIETNLKADCKYNNFAVYGCQKYTVNSKLQANDILSLIPANKQFIWLRDEGHINTNRWEDLLKDKAFKMINITATPDNADIKCNFTNTMMLRTVHQSNGTPEDALTKLLEVKKQHKKVKAYNPCAIFRCIADELTDIVINLCKQYNLKYINITEEDFDMSDLCKDDNEYDVIINKFKIVEGIDIRRAHVLYLDNQPSNNRTTIQVIGRCRRNALLYREDIDIFAPENKQLLENTRQCFVFYNVENMKISEDENGELSYAFCDHISIENLKCDSSIHVTKGQLDNGLYIIELENETGYYRVLKDKETGFNIVKPSSHFYKTETKLSNDSILLKGLTQQEIDAAPKIYKKVFDYATGQYITKDKWETQITKKPKESSNYKTTLLLTPTKCNLPQTDYDIELHETAKTFAVTITYYKGGAVNNFSTYIARQSLPIQLNYYDATSVFAHKAIYEALDKENRIKETKTRYFKTVAAREDFIKKLPAKKQINSYIYSAYNIYTQNIGKIDVEVKLVKIDGAEKINFDKDVNITFFRQSTNKTTITITQDEYEKAFNIIYSYSKIYNDRESAIIGTDLMKQVKDAFGREEWIEDKAVTTKVKRSSKLNTFIETRYQKELASIKDQLFTGQNNFKFDPKCNKCLGYCVEYYSKYLVYGEIYLREEMLEVCREANIAGPNCLEVAFANTNLVIRACMIKYRNLMVKAYGKKLLKIIPTISAQQLIRENYAEFVKTVAELGTKAANFVKQELNVNNQLQAGDKLYDPNLSIKHIAGLADYINKNTIIDIKTTNYINISHIKQVLAYHYLSTKRSDLDIKTVIVYDAVSGRSVKISL